MRAKNIAKRLLALLLLSTVPLLSSCHGQMADNKNTGEEMPVDFFEVPEKFDEDTPIELTFWAKNDTNVTQTRIYEQAIKDFETIYPNVKIHLNLYTDYGRIYNDVITNIATGTTPNVCITYPDHIATYITGKDIVAPLDSLMADEKYGLGGREVKFDAPRTEDIIPKFLNECKISGVQYAMPYMRSTEACYVNKTYVEKLGFTLPKTLTWDFIWQVAKAATEKDADGNFKVNGQKVMMPIIYKSTDNMMIQMLKQLEADYSTESGEIKIFNDTTRDLLYTVAENTESGAFCTFKIAGYPANFLNAGQCIFAIDSTAGATWMGSDAPLLDISEDKLVKFETEVMTIPQFDPENPQMISQGPSVCVFNKENEQEVLASWLFVQYLLSDKVQIAYAKTEGYLPVTSKAQANREYIDYISNIGIDEEHYEVKIKASNLLRDNIDNTFVTPVFNGSASLRNAAGQLIENVTKSVRRKQTVDDAYIEKLYDEVSALYRLDQFEPQITDNGEKNEKEQLGELPTTSKILLSSLTVIWCFIIIYVVISYIMRKKSDENSKNS